MKKTITLPTIEGGQMRFSLIYKRVGINYEKYEE